MLPRFAGECGTEKLIEVLMRQSLVSGSRDMAIGLANKAKLIECAPGQASEVVISQGNTDTDIYFIIVGSVSVFINGRKITNRGAGQHFGEMSLVDYAVRRSATIKANEPTLLAKVSEPDFCQLAQSYPQLWRSVAVQIGNRLRERSNFIRPPHNQSTFFIGSASERLDIARAIQSGLAHDPFVTTVWTDGIFRASRTPIENLMRAVDDADFAALVITPDDLVESRGTEQSGPRDDVVFELGLFMGGIGRERTFLILPRGIDVKIPTDLLGLTPIEYQVGDDATLTARIAPVCTELRRLILHSGPK